MNQRYEAKFGHIFIICASGKSAQNMLVALKNRQATGMTALMGRRSPVAYLNERYLQWT